MTDTTTTPGMVSRNCSQGKHHRCIGTVNTYPPVDGKSQVPCACTEPGCTHDQGNR